MDTKPVREAEIEPASAAFLYGNEAGSGTVQMQPFGDGAEDVALLGGESIVRLQAGSNPAEV